MRMVRFSMDMPADEHMYLKIASAKLGISMHDFTLQAIENRLTELEDEIIAIEAAQMIKDIESGKEETISWDEMKKRIM